MIVFRFNYPNKVLLVKPTNQPINQPKTCYIALIFFFLSSSVFYVYVFIMFAAIGRFLYKVDF